MTVTAPRPEPAARLRLRPAPVRRGRLLPLVALAMLTTIVGAGLHATFRMSLGESGTTPVRVSGLSLVVALAFLVVPPAMLAVAARRHAWFSHWAAGAAIGVGTWFAFGAMSPSLALAGGVGAAVALPVRYPMHRVVRVAALMIPGTFTWLVIGTGSFSGFSPLGLIVVLATPLSFVVLDLVTWDGPRLVMRQLGRSGFPGRMDAVEAARFERQVEWQHWSLLGLLVGMSLVILWWGGGRAPYRPAFALVPVQVDVTDTWLDVNGEYGTDWTRSQNGKGDASTFRVFRADGRRARLSVTNTGNPLLAGMYFDTAYGAAESVEQVSLNALATPTIVRSVLLDAERVDCTRLADEGGCAELVYTASLDQYLVEVVMTRPAGQVKVGQLSPLVDQVLDQVDRRLGR